MDVEMSDVDVDVSGAVWWMRDGGRGAGAAYKVDGGRAQRRKSRAASRVKISGSGNSSAGQGSLGHGLWPAPAACNAKTDK